jgi:hypothetical protein
LTTGTIRQRLASWRARQLVRGDATAHCNETS